MKYQSKSILIHSSYCVLFYVAMLIPIFSQLNQRLYNLLHHPPNFLLSHNKITPLPRQKILPEALPLHPYIGPPLTQKSRRNRGTIKQLLLHPHIRPYNKILRCLPSLQRLAARLNRIVEKRGYYLTLEEVNGREFVIDHLIIKTII